MIRQFKSLARDEGGASIIEMGLMLPSRNHVVVLPVDDPTVAPLMVAGMPIKMSAYPDAQKRDAAPELDADRARILADFP